MFPPESIRRTTEAIQRTTDKEVRHETRSVTVDECHGGLTLAALAFPSRLAENIPRRVSQAVPRIQRSGWLRERLAFPAGPDGDSSTLEEARMKGDRGPGKPKVVKPNGRPRGRSERAGQGRESGGKRAARGNFPIVGIGASAGGLEAFTKLLEHLPADTGMAFVLVQHLLP